MTRAGDAKVERARAARAAGRLEEAALLYEEAAGDSDPPTRAHRLRHAGEIRLELGQIDRAEAALDDASALCRDRPDLPPLERANMMRPIAMLREAQDREDAARAAWAEAGRLYAQAGVDAGVAECAHRLQALGSQEPS